MAIINITVISKLKFNNIMKKYKELEPEFCEVNKTKKIKSTTASLSSSQIEPDKNVQKETPLLLCFQTVDSCRRLRSLFNGVYSLAYNLYFDQPLFVSLFAPLLKLVDGTWSSQLCERQTIT